MTQSQAAAAPHACPPSLGRRSAAPPARSRPKATNAAFISPCPGEHTSRTDPAWPGEQAAIPSALTVSSRREYAAEAPAATSSSTST